MYYNLLYLFKDDYIKINGFGLSDKWRCSEEDEDELELCDEDKAPVTNHFLAQTFHRDSSNRLSMQFLGESSRFVVIIYSFYFKHFNLFIL